jgi:Endoplasmic reticulum vesicle transporter
VLCLPALALQVVPTIYTDIHNHTIYSNQFSVTEHFRGADSPGGQNLPGVFFFYDLSPIKVRTQGGTVGGRTGLCLWDSHGRGVARALGPRPGAGLRSNFLGSRAMSAWGV